MNMMKIETAEGTEKEYNEARRCLEEKEEDLKTKQDEIKKTANTIE